MELTFQKQSVPYLRRLFSRSETQEQTQELHLGEGLPDAGRVLGAWGQCVARGKQWSGSELSLSGAVRAWVLYAPEDGSENRVAEIWIPVTFRWELPEAEEDGKFTAKMQLKSIDARVSGARKILVRANVTAFVVATVPDEAAFPMLPAVPEDVQTLVRTYPLDIPREDGEKTFLTEDELTLPPSQPPVGKILCLRLSPRISETKLLGGKLVFRGQGDVKLSYLTQEGRFAEWEAQLPFSQFADLGGEYSALAHAQVEPLLTGLEAELTDGRIPIKCSYAGQYTVYDRVELSVCQDAYSPLRPVQVHTEEITLPVELEKRTQTLDFSERFRADAAALEDISLQWDIPVARPTEQGVELRFCAQVQSVYKDPEGMLRCAGNRLEKSIELPAGQGSFLLVSVRELPVKASLSPEGMEISGSLELTLQAMAEQVFSAVGALTIEAEQEPDPKRPSLLLRRMEQAELWDLAKAAGSTVERIRLANHLSGEPEQGKMLIIPVG
ncbi:MAG: DUF3794 domain-containing protein [Firmicutes bacterium]|nr:DUF3794 domain-containing protein [Bacillota bacterium]